MLSTEDTKKQHEKFCTDGVTKVRENLSNGNYGAHSTDKAKCAKNWLDEQDIQKTDETQSRTEVREEKSIKLAEDANSLSISALHLSRWAIGISIIGALIAIFKD